MVKLRLVALGTLLAIVALAFSLSALNRQRAHHVPKPPASQTEQAEPSAIASTEVPPAAASSSPHLASPTTSEGLRDYSVLPDGRPVPELPASAPKTCGFGAILFSFEGAQLAPRHARTKSEAFALAHQVIPEAEMDFANAVKKGDPGSLNDAGSINRGILERSVEYQLFTLEKGKVYPEPIETPRGYWILRRTR
jgi:hypothetical protein